LVESGVVSLASKARPRLGAPVLVAGAALLVGLALFGCRRSGLVPADAPRPTPAAAALPAGGDGGTAEPAAVRGRDIALLYTSNLQGKLTPCDCAVLPLGGLARRAAVIGRARGEADATIVVDAGDLYAPQGTPAETERQSRLLAAGVGRAGIDAFTPGESDLAIGVARLKALSAANKIPIVSANLYGRDGQRLFPADRLIDAAGTRIGIFGVTAPPTAADANRWRAEGIVVRDPADAAREEAASLGARGAAIVVALIHGGLPAENRRLVHATSGIDWAVLGHSALNLERPEKADGAFLLEAMSEGKYVGRLDLHVVGGSTAFADRGERAEVAATLADHQRQLEGYDRSLAGIDPASLEAYYQQRRQALTAQIALEARALASLPAVLTGSWFENRIIPLDGSVPDDPAVGALVRDYLVEGLADKHRAHL
jgi:2',3'-cyclic-nucleotide 2'-phosphodiesterase (5'-nucleotidase family)